MQISPTMDNDKDLFDYWFKKVRLYNHQLIQAPGHVQTQVLRHECTNYDELRHSREIQWLDEPERSKVIAIIKYECTAKVLQHRACRLRERADQLEEVRNDLGKKQSRLLQLIKALQEKLFGKDQEIKQLESRITILEAENEALQAEHENDKAYKELLDEFEQLQKNYEAVEKRRRELAKNNQSLGGRVAHTTRYKQQRDRAVEEVKALKAQLEMLQQENQQLRQENDRLHQELQIVQINASKDDRHSRVHETSRFES
jgi:chromosome segregation ATPase